MFTRIREWQLAYETVRKEMAEREALEEFLLHDLVVAGIVRRDMSGVWIVLGGQIRPGNPAINIGTAFQLAHRAGLRLSSGLSYSQVEASLPENKFPEGVKFNNWYSKEGYPGHNYAGIHASTVQEAVCRCVAMCIKEKLIDKSKITGDEPC